MGKPLSQCRKGREFVAYAEAHGATVRNGKGSHYVVSTARGACAVPCHTAELGKGIRCKIARTFAILGIVCLVLAANAANAVASVAAILPMLGVL